MAIRRATFERPELPSLFQCGGKGCAIVTDTADVLSYLEGLEAGLFDETYPPAAAAAAHEA